MATDTSSHPSEAEREVDLAHFDDDLHDYLHHTARRVKAAREARVLNDVRVAVISADEWPLNSATAVRATKPCPACPTHVGGMIDAWCVCKTCHGTGVVAEVAR